MSDKNLRPAEAHPDTDRNGVDVRNIAEATLTIFDIAKNIASAVIRNEDEYRAFTEQLAQAIGIAYQGAPRAEPCSEPDHWSGGSISIHMDIECAKNAAWLRRESPSPKKLCEHGVDLAITACMSCISAGKDGARGPYEQRLGRAPLTPWQRGQQYGIIRASAEARIQGNESLADQLMRMATSDIEVCPLGVRAEDWDLESTATHAVLWEPRINKGTRCAVFGSAEAAWSWLRCHQPESMGSNARVEEIADWGDELRMSKATQADAWRRETWLELRAALEGVLPLMTRFADYAHGEDCDTYNDCENGEVTETCPFDEEQDEHIHNHHSCKCGIWDMASKVKDVRAVLARTTPPAWRQRTEGANRNERKAESGCGSAASEVREGLQGSEGDGGDRMAGGRGREGVQPGGSEPADLEPARAGRPADHGGGSQRNSASKQVAAPNAGNPDAAPIVALLKIRDEVDGVTAPTPGKEGT